ncbi:energy transducer TonB [Myxococcus qinghaiensis]|uniref:energy transducer TonB n=1 Tax=Myxococcus qinghaiensis TaxID=2906758 RepID=UPI0020A7A8A8|nr:energy transducer TonB [Myxococcus qinghaiensis]MCP3165452.1 energy transducer TonB [Myxococcus qinghaiensis]
MRPLHVVLCSLLLGATACGHSSRVPSLPASHGHLSRAMARYLDPMVEHEEAFRGGAGPLYDSAPTVVVEPAQARAIFAEAVQVLSGTATEEQVKQAAQDLSAACDAELEEACTYQREQYQRPTKLEGKPPEMTREALLRRAMAVAVVSCRLGTDGIVRDLQVLEAAPYGLTEALLTALRGAKYQPAMLAGHPIEIPYTFQLNATFSHVDLTSHQELEWARARARNFPASPSAWAHLARVLARDLPDDPWYANALRYLNLTSPTYWWAATELAWLHAKAGRYAEAEPLARMARRSKPQNPYVLETAALVAFHRGQCKRAVLDQQRAVAKLPAEWPQEEQARFKSALAEYQRQCPPDTPAPAIPQAPAAPEPAPQQDTSTQGS